MRSTQRGASLEIRRYASARKIANLTSPRKFDESLKINEPSQRVPPTSPANPTSASNTTSPQKSTSPQRVHKNQRVRKINEVSHNQRKVPNESRTINESPQSNASGLCGCQLQPIPKFAPDTPRTYTNTWFSKTYRGLVYPNP